MKKLLGLMLLIGMAASAVTHSSAQYAPQTPGPPPGPQQYGAPPPGGQYAPPMWDQGWNRRPYPRSGACFFDRADFQGNHFCMNSGQSWQNLPPGFGDNISSMQVFGRARVLGFDGRNFTSQSEMFPRTVRDMRAWPVRGRPGKTWNNRISSIRVF